MENWLRSILSDVGGIWSIKGVRTRLEDWKSEDPMTYNDAYVLLCLPKLLSSLVRLQVSHLRR